MARGATLESILNKVRAKARLSLSPANNIQVRDSHVALIQAEQERLWSDFAWPHLRVAKLIPLAAGQHTYSLPEDDYSANDGTYTLQMDRVERISVREGGEWVPLHPEITEANYSEHETALDERSWPVCAWKADDNDQIEVWPIPDQSGDADTLEGYLRVTGIRDLRPLVEDGDRADLDDELLSYYVAADIALNDDVKKLRLDAGNKLYAKLKGKQTKTTSFNLFGATRRLIRRRPAITRYVP
jgi:hypothetical protein